MATTMETALAAAAMETDAGEPIDVLDRQPMLNDILRLMERLSAAKSSRSFAINGKWGAGKTFLLRMLERQLDNTVRQIFGEYTDTNAYDMQRSASPSAQGFPQRCGRGFRGRHMDERDTIPPKAGG